jgi:MFS family permease
MFEGYPLLNPFTFGRWTYLHGRRGWARLWRAPGANARFFIGTTYFWSVAIALTEPYKALYLSKLGLSNLAIGGFFALDMALRVLGVLAGGMFAQRWGHRRTLLIFDFTSWVIPGLALAFATEPWHVYVATCFAATNALVSGSVVQLMVEDTPATRRGQVFVLFNLAFVLPMVLLPGGVGWAVERWGVEPVMRGMFGLTALLTLSGILWRRVRLAESPHVTPDANLGALLAETLKAGRHLLARPGVYAILGSIILVNLLQNLNKAYSGLYVTQALGHGDGLVGGLATVGSLAFVVASLLWVPRLSVKEGPRLFFIASCLTVLPNLSPAFFPQMGALAAMAVLGGTVNALHGSLLNESVSGLLPPGREGLAVVLYTCVMQVVVAVGLTLGGAFFETHFGSFPWVVGVLAGLQAFLAWNLMRKNL